MFVRRRRYVLEPLHLLVERRIMQHQLLEQFNEADRRALTPLFYEHVNPYGLFALHLDQPSFLEAA